MQFGNRQWQINNQKTHPLPRGGTDLIACKRGSFVSQSDVVERLKLLQRENRLGMHTKAAFRLQFGFFKQLGYY